MIELRLQRDETLGVHVGRLEKFAEQRFDALEPFIDRAVASGAIPFTLVARKRCGLRGGVPVTHGRGF